MWYIIIVVIFIIIIQQVEKRTFHWETVVKYLWKQIYQQANLMTTLIHTGNETLYVEKYRKIISLRGNIINSILDFVNFLNKEKDEDAEEETFGYGRFNFDTILNTARANPEVFKNVK
jgi:hypothetical protein